MTETLTGAQITVRLLAGGGDSLMAVGDDDQNIYAFNGSSNEYIHRFCEDYGVAEPDFLTFNYRSSQHIISAANSVMNTQPGRLKALHPIVINPERQKQPNGGIWAERDAQRQGRVRVLCLPQQGRRKQKNNRQAQAVAAEIRRLQALGAECAEMAVLAFHNDTLKPVQAWCEQTDTAYFKKSSLRPSRLRTADKSKCTPMARTNACSLRWYRLKMSVEKQPSRVCGTCNVTGPTRV